ncbi:MAG: hypothetical protein ABIO70_15930 [Pseudomonadota bacterium]
MLRKNLRDSAQVVSVWRKNRKQYDYYLVPRGVRLRMAPVPEGRPAFGEALEALLPTLPKASIKTGSGKQARGRIVADRGKGGMSLGALIAIGLDKAEGNPELADQFSIGAGVGGGGSGGKMFEGSGGTMVAVAGGILLFGILAGWWGGKKTH